MLASCIALQLNDTSQRINPALIPAKTSFQIWLAGFEPGIFVWVPSSRYLSSSLKIMRLHNTLKNEKRLLSIPTYHCATASRNIELVPSVFELLRPI